MTLKVNEMNTSNFIINHVNFPFEKFYDRKNQLRVVDRLLDYLITWYTGKKSLFSTTLYLEYDNHSWVIKKFDSSSSFIQTLLSILDVVKFKELQDEI